MLANKSSSFDVAHFLVASSNASKAREPGMIDKAALQRGRGAIIVGKDHVERLAKGFLSKCNGSNSTLAAENGEKDLQHIANYFGLSIPTELASGNDELPASANR